MRAEFITVLLAVGATAQITLAPDLEKRRGGSGTATTTQSPTSDVPCESDGAFTTCVINMKPCNSADGPKHYCPCSYYSQQLECAQKYCTVGLDNASSLSSLACETTQDLGSLTASLTATRSAAAAATGSAGSTAATASSRAGAEAVMPLGGLAAGLAGLLGALL